MKNIKKILINAFAVIGLCSITFLVIAIAKDFSEFDKTKGGYEPPYEQYTGEPIDWNEGDVSNDGFARRGRVINTLLNCITGMITFEIFGAQIDFKKVSARAISVHKPREACIEHGFTPTF